MFSWMSERKLKAKYGSCEWSGLSFWSEHLRERDAGHECAKGIVKVANKTSSVFLLAMPRHPMVVGENSRTHEPMSWDFKMHVIWPMTAHPEMNRFLNKELLPLAQRISGLYVGRQIFSSDEDKSPFNTFGSYAEAYEWLLPSKDECIVWRLNVR